MPINRLDPLEALRGVRLIITTALMSRRRPLVGWNPRLERITNG